MKALRITQDILANADIMAAQDGCATLHIPQAGGGLDITEITRHTERYLVFDLDCLEDHSLSVNMNVYQHTGDDVPAFFIRFGILPKLCAKICLDLQCMDGHILFPESNPGQLKVVCHGRRVERSAMEKITLVIPPCFHDVNILLSDLTLTDEFPQYFPVPDEKRIDEMGQAKNRQWPGKVESIAQMRSKLHTALSLPDAYAVRDWDIFGGLAEKPLQNGTGYFTKARTNGRWTLVDPLGNPFFSMGPDGVVARADCRVDSTKMMMDWLPPEEDPVYATMYTHSLWPRRKTEYQRKCTLFSFPQANLYRAFGENWHSTWQQLMCRQLKQNGLNTLGNWSDPQILGKVNLPYVTILPEFPDTKVHIFRDFPDVFSKEYREDAKRCAQVLGRQAQDPLMIGYFLRNEPQWAFVDGLIIADEVLYNPAPSESKQVLIASLKEQYGSVRELAKAWQMPLESFEDLQKPIQNVSSYSAEARRDLRAFSVRMLDAYTGIPSAACRAADPNHMNLGMRWAWISDPDLVTGWKHFDVFSINCYAVDPTSALDHVVSLGVDLPILIGEYHFGALDAGQSATGLEAVASQKDRGIAYQYYTQRVAAHAYGVGCHWFQCYNQFELGRFDGENYNIGMFDICSLPNETLMHSVRDCSERIYRIKFGLEAPTDIKPHSIPMIAY